MSVYRGEGWEVREGRWQDSPPESVDVVISDPPFDDSTSPRARKHSGGEIVPTVTSFMGINPHDVGPPLVTIARRWVLCFCAIEQLGDYKRACGGLRIEGGAYVRGGAWCKTNPPAQYSGDRPATWGEGIAIMHQRGGKMRWNGGGHSAQYRYSVNTSPFRVHETQKPVALMLELVRLFSDPGELVWDPYCGSGTTGVACLRLGRRFLGHEMQPRYAKVAAERLAAEERGLTLRDVRAGQTSILDLEGMDDGV